MRNIATHALAAVLGVIAGGLVVTLATRALPQIMERMMARMGERG